VWAWTPYQYRLSSTACGWQAGFWLCTQHIPRHVQEQDMLCFRLLCVYTAFPAQKRLNLACCCLLAWKCSSCSEKVMFFALGPYLLVKLAAAVAAAAPMASSAVLPFVCLGRCICLGRCSSMRAGVLHDGTLACFQCTRRLIQGPEIGCPPCTAWRACFLWQLLLQGCQHCWCVSCSSICSPPATGFWCGCLHAVHAVHPSCCCSGEYESLPCLWHTCITASRPWCMVKVCHQLPY